MAASVPGDRGPAGVADPVFADCVAGPEIIRGEGDGSDTVRLEKQVSQKRQRPPSQAAFPFVLSS